MTRYQILIADPLLSMGPQWPDGMALAGIAGPGPTGQHWHFIDDPDAPAELEGRQVKLSLRRGDDGRPEVAGRRLVLTHLCPPGDDDELACCGLPFWELADPDSITQDKEAVTCPGPVADTGGDS